ncbi:MAG: adenosylcobinamide-phosphate synthase [Bryobacterales bacterium]|nr:adenosylcobinamide-phosphate synthase [Bryobacterales bacterium]
MFVKPWELLAGVALDLVIGDPQWLPHPVRAIGWLATTAERFWRGTGLPLRLAGVLFWLTVTGVSAAAVWLTLPWANVYWIYALLACRDLDVEATRVIRALERDDMPDARLKLSRIVGRDTEALAEPEILRATIETVAENLGDGVIAPLFYLAVAGPVGMAAYKAINTLDSMVGYRNDRYRDFGWASARIDDVANFLPARLTALLIWLAALIPGFNAARAFEITLRDGGSQPSPNSGYPEAAAAGALGVQLGGLNYYRGVPSRKPTLGDAIVPLTRAAFQRTRILLYASEGLCVLGCLAWR